MADSRHGSSRSGGFEVTGTEDFLRLSRGLKAAGRTDLRKELHKGLQEAAKHLIPFTRAEARAILPKRGGLNERIARAPQRVRIKTGSNPGVSLVAGRAGSGARGAQFGEVAHPVFNTGKWGRTKVPKFWLTTPIREHQTDTVNRLEDALERVARKVAEEVNRG